MSEVPNIGEILEACVDVKSLDDKCGHIHVCENIANLLECSNNR